MKQIFPLTKKIFNLTKRHFGKCAFFPQFEPPNSLYTVLISHLLYTFIGLVGS